MNEEQQNRINQYIRRLCSRYEQAIKISQEEFGLFHEQFAQYGEEIIKDSIVREYAKSISEYQTIADFKRLKSSLIHRVTRGSFRPNSKNQARNLCRLCRAEVDCWIIDELPNLINDLERYA